MKILITGAFGNIGKSTVRQLIKQGHNVRCFDLKTKTNKSAAKRFKNEIEIVWGDLRSINDLTTAVKGQDVVIHLAFIIPPISEVRPRWAREINVGGTQNLLNALKATPRRPKIIFASSVAVFGDTSDKPPPRRVSDPVRPIEQYAYHKVECEKLIRESGLAWSIFRFAAVPQLVPRLGDSLQFKTMFEVSLDTRIECIHAHDTGLALVNGVTCEQIWGKILLIGGGSGCQIYCRDYIGRMLEAMGIGMFPEKAFSSTPFHTDWMDTTESQKLLQYQTYSFEDIIKDMISSLGYKRYLMRPFRSFIRRRILRQSPYYFQPGKPL